MADKEEVDFDKMTPEEISELQKKNCIFCKIANKEIPSKIIYEDADIICILDINPASEGHVLVYPKKHYMIIPHLPEDLLGKLFSKVQFISSTLLKTLQCGGTTVFIANGSAAGQKAPHVLVHVFPRRENDGLIKLPKYEMNSEEIEKLKKEIKPYTNHLFGVTEKSVEKSSKEPVKKTVKHEDNVLINTEPVTQVSKPIIDSKQSEDIKENNLQDKKKKTGNLTLDDIGKLFGS